LLEGAMPAVEKTPAVRQLDRTTIMLWVLTLVVAVVMFEIVGGYSLGKAAAERDNRLCTANPAKCHK